MTAVDLMSAYGKRIYSENPNGLKLLGVCNEVKAEYGVDSVPDVTIKLDTSADRFLYIPSYDMRAVYPQVYVRPQYMDAADSMTYALELYRGERGSYKMNEIKNVTIKRYLDKPDNEPIRLIVEWDSYFNKKTEVCTYGDTFIPDLQSALARCFIMYRLNMKKLIFNDDVTVAIWDSGKKTIVRRNENEENDQDKAFYMCVAKCMIDEKKSLSNLLKKWTPDSQ